MGITVGGTFTNATVTGNYFSGTDAWAGSATNLDNSVTYEQDASSANAGLVLTPNTVVQTSVALPVTAPTVTSNGNTVTISDSDTKHRLSLFYTTDGSKPAVFGPGGSAGSTRLYAAPFLAASGATVNAIASWGQGANQGIVFPSFGYVPSSVVSAAVGSGGGSSVSGSNGGHTTSGHSLVAAYLSARGNANTMKMGSTLQFSAVGIYSDGTIAVLPDALGNKVTAWNTTNHKIARVSSQGHVTAMGVGSVKVQAMVGSIPASPWTVMVGGAVPAVSVAGTQAEARLSAAANASAEVRAMEAAATPQAQTQTSNQESGQATGLTAEPGGRGRRINTRFSAWLNTWFSIWINAWINTLVGGHARGRGRYGGSRSGAERTRRACPGYVSRALLAAGDSGGWIGLDLASAFVYRCTGWCESRCAAR